jgi:hypothetical protein
MLIQAGCCAHRSKARAHGNKHQRRHTQKEIHLEAFQCSKQAVQLWTDGWFREPGEEVSGVSKMKHPNDASVTLPVMISGKDVDEVDNDFFLVPLAVKDHQGPLLTSFPVEHRLTGQVRLPPLLLSARLTIARLSGRPTLRRAGRAESAWTQAAGLLAPAFVLEAGACVGALVTIHAIRP